MRLALSLVITLMTWVGPALAKSKTAPNRYDGRLITYQQFMRLSSDARKAYLRELQDILVLLEKNQIRYEVASNDDSVWRLKEQIAAFLKMAELLPSAAAETIGPVNAGSRRPVIPRWNSLEGKWLCDPAPPYAFDPTLGTCIFQYERRGSMLSDWTGACPSGMETVKNRDVPTVRCVPKESWNALSRSRKKEITTGVRFSPDFFDGEDSDFGRKYTHGGGIYENDGSTVAGRPSDNSGPSAPTAGAQPDPAAPAAPPAVPEEPTAPQTAEPATPPAAAEPAAPPAAEPPAAAPPAPTCRLEKLTCESLDSRARQNLINRFRKDRAANTCVAGGFFTKKTQRPAKGKGSCELKKEIKIGPATDKFPRGRFSTCGKDPETKKDSAACNPAVFCVGLKATDSVQKKMLDKLNAPGIKAVEDAIAKAKRQATRQNPFTPEQEKAIRDQVPLIKADQMASAYRMIEGTDDKLLMMTICAPVSQDMTKTCDQRLEQYLNGQRAPDGYPDFRGEGFEYVQCDPTKMKGFPLQDEWNKMAEDTYAAYKQQCGSADSNNNFRSLFCEECNVVAERIYKANQKAIGTGCTDVVGPGQPPAPGNSGAIREGGGLYDEN